MEALAKLAEAFGLEANWEMWPEEGVISELHIIFRHPPEEDDNADQSVG
jgi:hypothetical protein